MRKKGTMNAKQKQVDASMSADVYNQPDPGMPTQVMTMPTAPEGLADLEERLNEARRQFHEALLLTPPPASPK